MIHVQRFSQLFQLEINSFAIAGFVTFVLIYGVEHRIEIQQPFFSEISLKCIRQQNKDVLLELPCNFIHLVFVYRFHLDLNAVLHVLVQQVQVLLHVQLNLIILGVLYNGCNNIIFRCLLFYKLFIHTTLNVRLP